MQRIINRLKIFTIILFPVFYLGIGGNYPWILLGTHGKDLGFLSFFIITLIFIAASLIIKIETISEKKLLTCFYANLFIAAIFALLYDFMQYKHFLIFGYQKPLLIYALDSVLIISLIFSRRANLVYLFSILCGYFLIHHCLSIYYFPLVTARSDMFSAIILSLNQFTQGLNPYVKVLENVGTPPYLPLTILSFYPAIIMKCDPRIIALLYLAITLTLVIFKFNRLNNLSQITICLILINPYWLMRHDLYFQLFLLEITIIMLYFENFTEIIRIIFLGLFITTLQFAWILYPFILLSFSRNTAQLIRQAVASLLIAGLIVFGYTQNYFLTFYHAIFLHKEYLNAYNSDITFGLSTIFHFANNQIALYMLQIIGCGLLLLYSS